MLDVKNVSKTFAKGTVNEHIALEKINLHLDRGEFLTIVGSNGAGKSTLFNLICGRTAAPLPWTGRTFPFCRNTGVPN